LSKKIIVFDFDGVVCDSTDECMVTSWNAWEKWNKREGFRNSVLGFNKEYILSFREIRPRVRGAGEYYILCRSLSEGIEINNQDKYDKLEKDWKDYIEPFKEAFFDSRERLRKINLEAWIDLHPVFYDVIETMKVLNRQNRLYIATLKDSKSVKLILKKQGLVIEDQKLLDQSQIKTKLQALNIFRGNIGCSKNDIVFIDDNVTHLLEPKKSGYNVYLTKWSRTLSDYLLIAKINNIQTLSKSSLLLDSV